jgi:hypothetical protein
MTVLITQLIEPSVGEGKYPFSILMAASVEKLMDPVHYLWDQKFGEGAIQYVALHVPCFNQNV